MRPKVTIPTVVIALSAAISGALSGYFLLPHEPYSSATPGLNLGLQYGPGIFFGIFTAGTCLWLYRGQWKWSQLRSILWVVASIFAWWAALQVALRGSDGGRVSYMWAGALGALILACAFWIIVHRTQPPRLLLTVAAGSALGLAMSYILEFNSSMFGNSTTMMLAFVVWQVGVALVLIESLRKDMQGQKQT